MATGELEHLGVSGGTNRRERVNIYDTRQTGELNLNRVKTEYAISGDCSDSHYYSDLSVFYFCL